MTAGLRHPRAAATSASAAAWFCVLAAPAGVAQDSSPPELVQRAIERMAGVDVEPWSYRRVLDSREGRRVDRHEPGPDPSRHWVLESVDGRAPTAEELEEYREDQADHGRRAGGDADDDEDRGAGDADRAAVDAAADRDGDGRVSPAERVAGWFDPDGFAPLPGEPRGYRFRLRSPDGRRENAWAQIEGELHVAGTAEDPWIDRARLWNSEPFFAAFGVHMTRVAAEVRFEKVGEHIRPARLEVAFEGRAWLVRELDERLAFSFDDWRRADAAAVPAGDSP